MVSHLRAVIHLNSVLTALQIRGISLDFHYIHSHAVALSVYADDVNVFMKTQGDV